MFKRTIAAALIFGTAALAPPAFAQNRPTCMARTDLIKALEDRYKEALIGGGLQSPERLLEIWSSEETGTFTVIMTRPNGLSCIVATGQNWQSTTVAASGGVAG